AVLQIDGETTQSTGKIIVAGWARSSDDGGVSIVVARLTSLGALDQTFASSGKSVIGYPGADDFFGTSVAVLSGTSTLDFGDFGTFFADATGDGRADAIVVNYGATVVRPSNGTSFAANQTWSSTFWGERGTLFADVDGGGRADAIIVEESAVKVRLSGGSSFSSTTSNWTSGPDYSVR
ncbi:MAG TPA: hypothetical protein VK509_04860, partial [Polyangiales bacterium]|nr:hypothetical protein [Polyangiales bacterium]